MNTSANKSENSNDISECTQQDKIYSMIEFGKIRSGKYIEEFQKMR
jgi:hypothetical protein